MRRRHADRHVVLERSLDEYLRQSLTAGSLVAISDNNKSVTEKGRIVTFTSAGVQKDFTIPGGSQGLAGAPTGQIAYSAAGANPEQSGPDHAARPGQSFELLGDPFGVAYGADQAFWIVQFAAGSSPASPRPARPASSAGCRSNPRARSPPVPAAPSGSP